MANFVTLYCIKCGFDPKCIFITAQIFDLIFFGWLTIQSITQLQYAAVHWIYTVWFILTLCFYVVFFFGIYNIVMFCMGGLPKVAPCLNLYVKIRLITAIMLLVTGIVVGLIFIIALSVLGIFFAITIFIIYGLNFVWIHGYHASFFEAFGCPGGACAFGANPSSSGVQQVQIVPSKPAGY